MSFDLDNLLGLLFFVVFIVLPLFSRGKKKQSQQGKSAQGAPPRPPQVPAQPSATGAPRSPVVRQPTASVDRGASSTITLEEIARRVQEAQLRESGSTGVGGPPPAPSGQSARTSRGLVASDPFERTLVSSSQPRTVLGREGDVPQPSLMRPSVLGREGAPAAGQAHQGASVIGREGMPAGSLADSSLLGREGVGRQAGGRRSSPLGREGPTTRVAPSLSQMRQRQDKSARAAAAVIGEGEEQRRRSGQFGATLSPVGPLRFDRAGIMHGLIWHEVLGEPPSLKRLRRSRSRLH